MGVVDPERNKRPSWEVLREEFSPVLFDSLNISQGSNGQSVFKVGLHSRGPINTDMPVYTMRGYSLHWAVTSLDGSTKYSQGDVPLPTLAPASQWNNEITFDVPSTDYILTISIIRPTGYSVIERSLNTQGELIK
jgi:hypothetical protein